MAAIEQYGVGAGSDWSIAGYTDIENDLHEAIADFKGTEAGLSYQTGFAVNAGLLPQLLDEGTSTSPTNSTTGPSSTASVRAPSTPRGSSASSARRPR